MTEEQFVLLEQWVSATVAVRLAANSGGPHTPQLLAANSSGRHMPQLLATLAQARLAVRKSFNLQEGL